MTETLYEKAKKKAAVAKFGLWIGYNKDKTPSEEDERVKVMNSLTNNQINEFNELNKLLLDGGFFIKPCKDGICNENSEFKHLNAKAEFHVWRYLHGEWKISEIDIKNIFLKQDGQWMWGPQSFDGKKNKVPRGMKCIRRGSFSKGSNCAEGYTCDRKELKCVKKGTESKREFKIPKMGMFHRRKNAGRSRKKKTRKKRRRKRKRTKKKRRRRRR